MFCFVSIIPLVVNGLILPIQPYPYRQLRRLWVKSYSVKPQWNKKADDIHTSRDITYRYILRFIKYYSQVLSRWEFDGFMILHKNISFYNEAWKRKSSDAIWWQQRYGSALAQAMACCLMAASHHLNQHNVHLPPKVSCTIHLRAISHEVK